MALDRITYDVIPYITDLNLQDQLLYLDRMTLEVNSNDNEITATIELGTQTVVLATTKNIVRGHLELDIGRLGPINSIVLQPIPNVDWYSVGIAVRPLALGIRIASLESQTSHAGRAPTPGTELCFDINPFSQPELARHIHPTYRRLYLDMVGTMTPQFVFDNGSTQTLSSITHVTRDIADISLLACERVKTFKLLGDFTAAAQVVYGIELDAYIARQGA